MKIGFDCEKYVRTQSEHILERISMFGGKLYLEFGGKLFDDYHASRVLPGFKPDSKVNMLCEMRDSAEIVIVINASVIESSKQRGDLGITYDTEVLRLIDAFRDRGLYVGSVCITQWAGQSAAETFRKRLEALGIKVYKHYRIEGYPSNVATIVSEEGYGKNEYIETTRPLVVVTAPGPGSGKMAVCLSQLYHEHKRGVQAGYAKFETFPIWNMPIDHPVNIAYEAATVDLDDVNLIDPYHLAAYGVSAVNYNRDVEIFPVLQAIFKKISGECPYKSPTDMGVNMIGYCITDDEVVREASRQEIIRRFFACSCEVKQGLLDAECVGKIKLQMEQAGISVSERRVVDVANQASRETEAPTASIELPDGRIITGKTKSLLGASSAMLLNALKALGGIEDSVHLISSTIIEPIQELKIRHLGNVNPRLHTDEVLLALCICAVTDPNAALAIEQLPKLVGTEAHSTVILSSVDETTFRKLGVNITCEPQYQTKRLYHK